MEDAEITLKRELLEHEDKSTTSQPGSNATVPADNEIGLQDLTNKEIKTTSDESDDDVIYHLRKPEQLKPVIRFNQLTKIETDVDVKFFECPECHITFNTKTGVTNHLRKHIIDKLRKFTCSLCDQQFEKNSDLVSHKKIHDNEERDFSCKRCELAFTDYHLYLKHKIGHSKQLVYRCLECRRPFPKKLNYLAHLNSHFDNAQFTCDICAKNFRYESSYKEHLYGHEAGLEKDGPNNNVAKTDFLCGECGKNCKSSTSLRYHMMTHTGVKLLQCFYCGKGFIRSQARKIHMRQHTGAMPHKCEECGRGFRQAVNLTRHIAVAHLKERNFECEFCNKKFVLQHTLYLHRKLHTHEGVYKCKECGQVCHTKQSLRTHITYKHITEKSFKCDVCDKAFKTKSAINRHLRGIKHEKKVKQKLLGEDKEKLYTCHVCQKTFNLKSNFIRHLQKSSAHEAKANEKLNEVEDLTDESDN